MKDDSQASYNYAPKSRLIYQRSKGDVRSRTSSRALPVAGAMRKTPSQRSQVGAYTGEDGEVRSRLSKASIQRFNEQLPELGPKSAKSGSHISLNSKSLKSMERPSMRSGQLAAAASQKTKSTRLDEASLRALAAEKLAAKKAAEAEENAEEPDEIEVVDPLAAGQEVPEEEKEEGPPQDAAEEQFESVSQVKPNASQISKMTGATYISQL